MTTDVTTAKTMRAITYDVTGGPEVMQVKDIPIPPVGPNEVLIKVHAAGVNRPDVIQRQGLYPPPAGACDRLGLEVAGEVVAFSVENNVDADIDSTKDQPELIATDNAHLALAIGDNVCALTNGGGYAEYVVVDRRHCLPIPQGLSWQEAAVLTETWFTVWTNLVDRAQLQADEMLLIHGGASGIGLAALALAQFIGAQTIVTASSDDKCKLCSQRGATHVINYQESDFVSEVKRLTQDCGADVILDMVGGDYIQRNLSAAAVEGRIISIAFLRGAKQTVNLLPVMLKRLHLTGSTLRSRSAADKASIAIALHQNIWPWIASTQWRPHIHAEFALHDVVAAHRLLESNQVMGKVVLTMPHG